MKKRLLLPLAILFASLSNIFAQEIMTGVNDEQTLFKSIKEWKYNQGKLDSFFYNSNMHPQSREFENKIKIVNKIKSKYNSFSHTFYEFIDKIEKDPDPNFQKLYRLLLDDFVDLYNKGYREAREYRNFNDYDTTINFAKVLPELERKLNQIIDACDAYYSKKE